MNWRKVWKEGIVPQLRLAHLKALRDGLQENDKAWIQGATTSPPPLQCIQDWPTEAACLLGYCEYRVRLEETGAAPCVGEIEEFFAHVCYDTDCLLGEPASIRWFLNWVDESPREEVRLAMLPEVLLAIETKTPQEEPKEVA